MSYKITFDSMIAELKEGNPGFADQIVDYYPSGQMELVIKLQDGSRWRYDYRLKTLSRLPFRVSSNEDISEQEWRDNFAAKLRRRMYMKGYTQIELARATGIPHVSIGNYMRASTTPSGYNIDRLCRVLECPASELVNA